MKVSWRVLAKKIGSRLPPGFVRLQGDLPKARKVSIVAFYRNAAPKVAPFTLTIGGVKLTVEVRTVKWAPPVAPEAFGVAGAAFSGVHPGGALAVDLGGGVHELGGICALLSKRQTDPQPSHLVTCGHVFRPKSKNTDVIGGFGGTEDVIGTLVTNLLDAKQNRRDVALVALTPTGSSWATGGGPGPKLEGYFPENRIFNRTSRTFQPTNGGYSKNTKTSTTVTNALIHSPLWPGGFDVVGVIGTTAAVSQPGDSGTILATASTPIAIGSCTASGGGQSLFEPIGRAIDDIFKPTYQLTLWRNP